MHDGQLIFSRRQPVHGIDERAVDGQRTLASAGYEQAKRLFEVSRGNRKKLRAHRAAGNDGLFSPGPCRNFIAGGDSLGEFGEEFVGQARLRVWFEDDIGHAAEPRRQQHRPRGVAADSKSRNWFVLSEYASRVQHRRRKHGEVS